MSTAREMFEELGYKNCKETKTSISFENYPDIISFDIEEQTFHKWFYDMAGDISMQELQAINQMVKELGWLDEEQV